MSFRFCVHDAGYLPSANVYFVDGIVESGIVREGDRGFVEDDPAKSIVVKSIAFIDSPDRQSGGIAIAIEPPPFDISELIDNTVVSV